MTSATIRQARGASRGEGYWMIVFAAVLLGMLGLGAYGSRDNLAS